MCLKWNNICKKLCKFMSSDNSNPWAPMAQPIRIKPKPKAFKWCTCHTYLSVIKHDIALCFKDCELRTPDSDSNDYYDMTMVEYIMHINKRRSNKRKKNR